MNHPLPTKSLAPQMPPALNQNLANAYAASGRTPWVPSPAWCLCRGRETANESSVMLTGINI
jgi:hypothetical protein